MIYFKYIEIEDFCSIEYFKYTFENKGLHIIYGENGAGKSTIPNSLSWVLYGRSLNKKSVEPWEHIKGSLYKGTQVKVVFRVSHNEYEIIRNLKKVSILKNGKALKLKKKTDLNKWIINKLGYSFDLFKSSIIFGQKLKRLMNEDTEVKKKILEETFETAFIQKAREEVILRLNRLDIAFKENKWTSESLKSNLGILKEQIGFIRKSLKEERKVREKEKQEINNKLAQIRNKLSGEIMVGENLYTRIKRLNRLLKKVMYRYKPEIENEIFKSEMYYNSLGEKMDKLVIDIKNLKKDQINIPRKCDKCGQDIPKNQVMNYIKSIKKQMKELNESFDEYAKEQAEVDDNLNNLKGKNITNKYYKNKITKYQERIKKLTKNKTDLDYNIKTLENEIKTHKERLKILDESKSLETKQNLRKLRNQSKEFQEQLNLNEVIIKEIEDKIETHKWLINDPLSNSGLKVFIFNTMLSNINQCLKAYTEYIGFNIKLSMNLDSHHKNLDISVWDKKIKKPYEDLSGGQQQLIDVALLFGLNDAGTMNKPINIMFLDEVFESLTQINIEKVEQLILVKSNKKSLHLITHTNSFTGIKGLHLELDSQGHTCIVN